MTQEASLSSIGQISVNVQDLDAAVDFYGGKLGLRLIGRFPPGLTFFDCGGVRLMVSEVSEDRDTGNSVLYFNVPDISEGYEALKSRGVEFTREPHVIHSAADYELWMAFFQDPDGNDMAVMEERGELTAP